MNKSAVSPMGKIIGITTSYDPEKGRFFLYEEYKDAVANAGGIPVILPALEDIDKIRELSNIIDGLILSGGGDVHPHRYGKEPSDVRLLDMERDHFEFTLLDYIFKAQKPILGICRGCQVINVYFGGTLNQHIERMRHWQLAPEEYPSHPVKVKKGTLLYEILEVEEIRVNSFHHQVIEEPGEELVVSAKSVDGFIEAVENTSYPFLLGVQFHIELLIPKYPIFLRIFKRLVDSIVR